MSKAYRCIFFWSLIAIFWSVYAVKSGNSSQASSESNALCSVNAIQELLRRAKVSTQPSEDSEDEPREKKHVLAYVDDDQVSKQDMQKIRAFRSKSSDSIWEMEEEPRDEPSCPPVRLDQAGKGPRRSRSLLDSPHLPRFVHLLRKKVLGKKYHGGLCNDDPTQKSGCGEEK